MDTTAFFDELQKMATLEDKQGLDREKMMRALKTGLVSAGGMGVGYGIGNLLADTVLPKALAMISCDNDEALLVLNPLS